MRRDSIEEVMKIQPPHLLENSPNAYSFTRKREISDSETFWDDILNKIGITDEDYEGRRRSRFKNYFLNNWGEVINQPPSQIKIDEMVLEISPDWSCYLHNPDTVYTTVRKLDVERNFHLFKTAAYNYRKAPVAGSEVAIDEGCIIGIKLMDGEERWFQPHIFKNENEVRLATKSDFSQQRWEDTWSQLSDLVQVFYIRKPATPAEQKKAKEKAISLAKESFSAIDIVRADAPLIEQQYKYIKNDKDLAQALDDRANDLLEATIPTAPLGAIPSLTSQYKDLKSQLPKIETVMQQLENAASDLGYKLFLSKTKVKYIDEKGKPFDQDIEAGKLFKAGQKTVAWVTYQTVTKTRRSLFRKRKIKYKVPIEHRKSFTYYQPADLDYDPWTEVADAYRRDGYSVYLFRETADGLVSPDGSSINEVLEQCSVDESFRKTCAIAVPFYEYTIIGEKLLVGYVFMVRPLPEISPAEFPRININENLTYKFAWTGVSLGELATTIPLAPGEERTVSVSVSQNYKSKRSVSTSSLTEITRVDKSDFETTFEKEVRKEKETNTTKGGSVGGSYGGFSGSASFSKSTKTKDMSRQLNRSVQRASQELTRRSKQEVKVSFTEEVETNTTSTTTYKMKNINEGRTLNITFHRLMNDYSSNLYLNDFDFYVEGGRELIMGTDVREGKSFSRNNLSSLWMYLLKPEVLPIDLSDKADQFKAELCKAIANRMKLEYGESSSSDDKTSLKVKSTPRITRAYIENTGGNLKKLNSLESKTAMLAAISKKPQLIDAKSRRMLDDAIDSVFSTENCDYEEYLNRAFAETSFSLDSGSLHADAHVGLRPATEAYSENMRRLEEQNKTAQNRLVNARASLYYSRSAKHLLSIQEIIDPKKVNFTDRMALYEQDGHVSLRVRLSNNVIPSSGWAITFKNLGRYLQDSSIEGGVVVFRLPRRFGPGSHDIGNQSHVWYENNVSFENYDLKLSIPYKRPSS